MQEHSETCGRRFLQLPAPLPKTLNLQSERRKALRPLALVVCFSSGGAGA